jgi:hypothetical protein
VPRHVTATELAWSAKIGLDWWLPWVNNCASPHQALLHVPGSPHSPTARAFISPLLHPACELLSTTRSVGLKVHCKLMHQHVDSLRSILVQVAVGTCWTLSRLPPAGQLGAGWQPVHHQTNAWDSARSLPPAPDPPPAPDLLTQVCNDMVAAKMCPDLNQPTHNTSTLRQ